MQPYLLLDAGGTVLFPNQQVIRRIVLEHGYDIPEEQLRSLMWRFIRHIDGLLKDDGQASWSFFDWVLQQAGVDPQVIPVVTRHLHETDAKADLWDLTYPWVHQALADLTEQGYRISVVSNATGRVEAGLHRAGLGRYLEKVFDSHVVGYEKPDVRLFRHALSTLGLRPEECLFVGDVYHVDVLGANRSGIAAVHLDPCGLYDGWAGYHIPNVAALPGFLEEHQDLSNSGLFPLA